MPTGYTAGVADGSITEFREFALQCARAFGALVTMRDDPEDAEIPEAFEPSTYHAKALTEATDRLNRLQEMTDAECDEAAAAEYESSLQRWNDRQREIDEIEARYLSMLEQANAYTAPTSDHVRYREFMIDQLEDGLRFDCSRKHDIKPEPLHGAEWKTQNIMSAEDRVRYHAKESAAELERTRQRNDWIRQLRVSLA